MRSLPFLMAFWGFCLSAWALDPSAVPPPNPLQYLAVQRSAALFNARTSQRAFNVRVVVYGQSIAQQQWAWAIVRNLYAWQPGSEVTADIRSISAFASDFLLQTAESDIYPFRPDVIVFHAYGPYGPGAEWEQLLRAFRTRTTADIILLGNHPRYDAELDEAIEPGTIAPNSEAWLNYVTSPALANELGLCFPDNRSAFKAYLKATKQPVQAILADNVHFNELGSDLQLAVVRPFLQAPRLAPGLDPFNNGRVQTHPIGPDGPHWVDGRLRLEFVGNRVDAIAGPGFGRRCQVRVDGQEPTSLPSGLGHRRSGSWRGEESYRPALLHVGFTQKPLVEQWTLTVTDEDPNRPDYLQFEVRGSQTGQDGAGSTTNVFVSTSGRVRIAPENWNLRFRPRVSQLGMQIGWETEARAVDEYSPTYFAGVLLEPVTTLFNDLVDGPHVLELTAESPETVPAIESLRVYHPGGPMFGTESLADAPPTLRFLSFPDRTLAVWPGATPDWRPFRRSALDLPGSAVTPAVNFVGFSGLFLPMDEPSGFFQLERQ